MSSCTFSGLLILKVFSNMISVILTVDIFVKKIGGEIMNKPTLFFSHSSKDKDMVLAIKNKIMQYTSNTIDIFQSSDGESIPFGTNWVHKIEEGLDSAKIMFVFVTENSISSGWIYFETGYAYSKGIHVIPVGIGVNIGDLKAPLNLLQGYNITSADSFNNFLTIINREFQYNFPPQFDVKDYDEIVSLITPSNNRICQFDNIVQSVKFTLNGTYHDAPGNLKTINTKNIFDNIKSYLDENEIDYSLSKHYGYGQDNGSCIHVRGIKFIHELSVKFENTGNIYMSISPYNFVDSFELFVTLIKECMNEEDTWIQIRLKDGFNYKTHTEDCAALIMKMPELFSLSKSGAGGFESEKLGLHFSIYNNKDYKEVDYVLGIGYDTANVKAANIIELVSKLYDLQIIEKIGGSYNG